MEENLHVFVNGRRPPFYSLSQMKDYRHFICELKTNSFFSLNVRQTQIHSNKSRVHILANGKGPRKKCNLKQQWLYTALGNPTIFHNNHQSN